MTATVSADVPLDALQKKLATVGQWLPIDGEPSLPIGQLVAMNSTGPLRLGFGAWRDLLLGCQFRNGQGELITAGGRAIKNVAGYDLTKLMVGQQGMLGKIVTITTRTYKRPDARLAAAFKPDLRVLDELQTNLLSTAMGRAEHGRTRVRICRRCGDDRLHRAGFAEVQTSPYRSGTRLTTLASLSHNCTRPGSLSALQYRRIVFPAFVQTVGIQHWVADAAFGIVRGCCDEPALLTLRHAATSCGGTLWLEQHEDLNRINIPDVQRAIVGRLTAAMGMGE